MRYINSMDINNNEKLIIRDDRVFIRNEKKLPASEIEVIIITKADYNNFKSDL